LARKNNSEHCGCTNCNVYALARFNDVAMILKILQNGERGPYPEINNF